MSDNSYPGTLMTPHLNDEQPAVQQPQKVEGLATAPTIHFDAFHGALVHNTDARINCVQVRYDPVESRNFLTATAVLCVPAVMLPALAEMFNQMVDQLRKAGSIPEPKQIMPAPTSTLQ